MNARGQEHGSETAPSRPVASARAVDDLDPYVDYNAYRLPDSEQAARIMHSIGRQPDGTPRALPRVGGSLGKERLVREVARTSHLSQRQVRIVVNAALAEIRAAMARGETVTLTGFGSFEVAQAPGRTKRIASTEGPTGPVRRTLRFRVSPQLERTLRANEERQP